MFQIIYHLGRFGILGGLDCESSLSGAWNTFPGSLSNAVVKKMATSSQQNQFKSSAPLWPIFGKL